MTTQFLTDRSPSKPDCYQSLSHASLALFAFCIAVSATTVRPVHAQTSTCADAVNAALAEWHSIGFSEPSKPGQSIVRGTDGHHLTAGQYYYLRGQLSGAVQACQAGRDTDAMQKIQIVRNTLGRSGPKASEYATE
jgi:hypothetical protein